MKNKFLFILPFLAISLCGCNDNESSSSNTDNITIVDGIGREISVKKGSYNRVLCIGAGALRLYSYVGDATKLCAVEDIDNVSAEGRPMMFDNVARPYFIAYKDVFNGLPTCGKGGPNAQIIETEKILMANPDIIISEYEDTDKATSLEQQVGVPVVTVCYGSKGVFDEKIKNSLSILGTIFDKEERSNTIINFIESEKNEISNRTLNIKDDEKKNVYICGLGNYGTTNHLMTAQNYEPFNVAHIDNVINDLPTNGIQKITDEKFVSVGEKTDVLIIDAAAMKNIIPLYKENNDMFSSFKAFKNGEVYLQMAYNAYYTNVEIALANTWYNAKVTYPSRFADINIDDKLSEITKTFLTKDLTSEIYEQKFSYGGYQKINVNEFFK